MGKASKWFRNILGLKKSDQTHSSHPSVLPTSKGKRRWSFVKSYRIKESQNDTVKLNPLNGNQAKVDNIPSTESEDPNKHAVAVAKAAIAAAHAAATVVSLTSSTGRPCNYHAAYVGGWDCGARDELAAIKIQSAFRGYLARRALRALRGLVRLQALVRGHIERKRTVEWLRRMQALLRAQARARLGRAQISESSESSGKFSHFHHPGPSTPEKFEHSIRTNNAKYQVSSVLKRNGSKSNDRLIDDLNKAHVNCNWSDCRSKDQKGPSTRIGATKDEKGDKMLETDTGKPHFTPQCRNFFHSSPLTMLSDQYSHTFTTSKDSTTFQTVPSPPSCEVQSLRPIKLSHEVEERSFCTAENSPQFFSASSKDGSSKRSPFTPAKSYSSQSCLTGYSDHPNYMAYTESSRAKVRSLSAPKQRPQYEKSSSAKRYSVHGFGESKSAAQNFSSLHANFINKAYPGSGRLDSFGMPVGYRY